MPLAAIVGAALTTHAAHAKSLWVDGLDVLLEPGTGTRYLTPIDTVQVTESGPGGVSSMSFTIQDPGKEITLAEGGRVLFWDHDLDAPLFAGFLQGWTYVPQASWRRIEVECVGIEAVLDWMVVPSLTVPSLTLVPDAFQMVMAAATGIGVPLNVAQNSGLSSLDQPISNTNRSVYQDVVLDGLTVRQAFEAIIDAGGWGIPATTGIPVFTVDFYGGVRTWYSSLDDIWAIPSDYTGITVSNTVGGARAAVVLDHRIDALVPHQAFVQGGSGAGTGLATDGTGFPGPVAVVNDDQSVSADGITNSGQTYLVANRETVRGRVELQLVTPIATERAGTKLTLTDATVGVTSEVYRVASITKTFDSGGTETWTIAYGGHPPSAIRQMRHLTRAVRS